MEVESGDGQLAELTTLELTSENPEDGTDPNYALQFIDGQINYQQLVTLLEEDEDDDAEDDKGENDETIPEAAPKSREHRGEGSKSPPSPMEEPHRKRRKRLFERKTKLSPILASMMGEANLRYARGQFEDVEKFCMEVIRQAPHAAEPYQTLGMLYEEMGDMEKSYQFRLIAAHLGPTDVEEWLHLGEIALEREEIRQAKICYRHAYKTEKDNMKVAIAYGNLMERDGEKRAAFRLYVSLLPRVENSHPTMYMTIIKEIARLHHEFGTVAAAREVMSEAFRKYPSVVSSEDVNLLLELLAAEKKFDESLSVLIKYCQVEFDPAIHGEGPVENVNVCRSITLPDPFPVDLQAKLIVALIQMDALHLAQVVCDRLSQEDAEEVGDLFLDVAEAYMEKRAPDKAIPLLDTLCRTKNYSLPAVWLRYAECLHNTHQLEKTADAYKMVLNSVPEHTDARLALSQTLNELGRGDEAIVTLSQADDGPMDGSLLYHRCKLLLRQEKHEEFISKALLFFSRHFFQLEKLNDIDTALLVKMPGGASVPSQVSEGFVSWDDEMQLLFDLCQLLFQRREFSLLERVCIGALGSKVFRSMAARKADIPWGLYFNALQACYFNRDFNTSYKIVRDMVFFEPMNHTMLYLLNLIISRMEGIRHHKFLMRLQAHHVENAALGILNGNNSLISGTYKYALGDYMNAFKVMPDNPLIALLIGITFVHIACQKFVNKKHSLVVQGLSFLNTYLELRGECQETYYNLGRAMQQLGIMHMAVQYYKKALDSPPAVKPRESEPQVYDLSREIAYNLALIYRGSGSEHLARFYIRKYLSRLKQSIIVAIGGSITFCGMNIYCGSERFYREVVPPIMSLLPPETAHRVAIKAARFGIVPKPKYIDSPLLKSKVFGLDFPNPVGLAAGFDKDGEGTLGLLSMGFGSVEIGSVTPKPQPGNPSPRIFRLPEDGAIINRYGFNSHGHQVVHDRLKSQKLKNPNGIIGVNLGRNKDSDDPISDYAAGIHMFADVADYFVINISSPNTPRLREMQEKGNLEVLLDAVLKARDEVKMKRIPVLLKVSPDLSPSERKDIVGVITKSERRVDGLVVSNTTTSRPESLQSPFKEEDGGLSGKPINAMATEAIRDFYSLTKGKVPIIGVGGISCGKEAYEKLCAGASLLQLYTSLVYEGPTVVSKIKQDLEELLSKDGYESLSDVIGRDVKIP